MNTVKFSLKLFIEMVGSSEDIIKPEELISESGLLRGVPRHKYFTSFLENLKVHLKLKTIDLMGETYSCVYIEKAM